MVSNDLTPSTISRIEPCSESFFDNYSGSFPSQSLSIGSTPQVCPALQVTGVSHRDVPTGTRNSAQNPTDIFDREVLPLFIEETLFSERFENFVAGKFLEYGIDPAAVNRRYGVFDVHLATDQRTLMLPMMVASFFTYEGIEFCGPFMGGHLAGLSMLQSHESARSNSYAKQTLPPKYDEWFTPETQTHLIGSALKLISNLFPYLVVASPNFGDAEKYLYSNIARVFVGGQIDDVKCGVRALSRGAPSNLVRALPVQVDPSFLGNPFNVEGQDKWKGRQNEGFSRTYTYYSFMDEPTTSRFMLDPRFLTIIEIMRNSSDAYRAAFPGEAAGFDPSKNAFFWSKVFDHLFA